ncbi:MULTISPECIES: accessory gene regulator B family protein [unclassified Clostridium]|uniref:accessory gene regulator B family protein n=1 Tax=Clostridium TaxID=1485 RepID=UPI0018AB21E3|nr:MULTISPECIES: accessory gene regulator B family protein [unclassified Clostridium]MBX9139216.1 accessory regulator AgrB [Clostridium sp. K12(2020)]MBX9145975.1 accessory regulator AgrB [Clostridium sp. K13]MDU4326519.1 accessory gene regulator B family protein [Clostridium celatum]
MIDKIINWFIRDLQKHNNYNEIQVEQMKYFMKVTTYEFIKLVLVLLIFFLLGFFKECFVIIIFMMSTKPFTGGYHEDTQIKCFVGTLIIVSSIILISKNSNLDIVTCIILNLISIFCIYNQIPIINEKMPLTKKKLIKRNRYIGIVNTLVFLVISIIMFNLKWFSQTIVWTCVVQVMLLFNKYKKIGGIKNED